MAKICKAPIDPPVLDYKDYKAYNKACDDYLDQVCKLAPCGKVVRFPVADGYATYVVWTLKPLQLVHIDTCDGYRFQYDYLLGLKEVKEKIKQQEAINEIFDLLDK